jgi:hypothetical protein
MQQCHRLCGAPSDELGTCLQGSSAPQRNHGKGIPWRWLYYFLILSACACQTTCAQTTLYNGIRLDHSWPPRRSPSQAYQVPSYITNPPSVIPIDLGRQLFVDDFLILQSTLTRTAHRPVMYAKNPVLAPDSSPDLKGLAFPYGDGVWYDPADHLFKMWYLGSYGNMISYAYSTDGKNWTKPTLSSAVIPGSNTVLQIGGGRDSDTVWMDLDDPNPARKFKAFPLRYPPIIDVYFSPDGIHWSAAQPQTINSVSDRTTVFWNPFRKVWVDSARSSTTLPAIGSTPSHYGRVRYYSESPDRINWKPVNPLDAYWAGPDVNDPPYAGPGGALPELYNLDAIAYESVLVGLFSWFNPGPAYGSAYGPGPDLVELGVGFSRDGFNWVRPTRGGGPKAFIAATNIAGTWNAYNTQSTGGGFLVVGDELWFYFSGRTLQKPATGIGSTGLAVLRRDGFYSMDAGASEGVLITRPVRFSGKYLFVNVSDPQGALQVEVLDSSGNVIAPFARQNSVTLSVDKTLQQVTWNGVADLSTLSGRPVEFRFYLTNGALYSFWVSQDLSGASHGYVAAGGPGFVANTDTVGSASSRAAAEEPGFLHETKYLSDTPSSTALNVSAGQHYVAPNGSSSGDGSINDPWDLQTALKQPSAVQPGDTIWLRDGVYGNGATIYTSNLNGSSAQPIIVRQYPNERATVNGGITVNGSNTWFWGFEVANKAIRDRNSNTNGQNPPSNFPSAFTILAPGTKFINLLVHDGAEGFEFWAPAQNSEIYGSLIYNNGWQGTDRGHGHGIYTQNKTGVKNISDNIIFQGFGLGIQCYGSPAAYVQNYVFDGNTIFNSGALSENHQYNLLITGGHGPQNITVTNNYTYHTPADGTGMSALDWGDPPTASNLTATGNYWIGGNPALVAFNWKGTTFTGNTAYSQGGYTLAAGKLQPSTYTWDNNTYYGGGFQLNSRSQSFASWQSATGLDKNSTATAGAPKGTWVFVRPNRYEAGRANITIYNWNLASTVVVEMSNVLTVGRPYEVRNAQDFFGAPVVSGTYNGSSISIPMAGQTVAQPQGIVSNPPKPTGPEFGVFVLLPVSPHNMLSSRELD